MNLNACLSEVDNMHANQEDELFDTFKYSEASDCDNEQHVGDFLGQLIVGRGGVILAADHEACTQIGADYLSLQSKIKSKKILWMDLFSPLAPNEIVSFDFNEFFSDSRKVEFNEMKITGMNGLTLFINIAIWPIGNESDNTAIVLVSDARRKDSYFKNIQKLVLSDLISNHASDLLWSCKSLVEKMNLKDSKNFELLLFELVNVDVVTSLPNRKMFIRVLNQLISDVSEIGRSDKFGLAVLRVDNFSLVNKKQGIEKGDLLLALVGSLLKEAVRASDIVARIGDAEFAILLTGVKSVNDLSVVAERVTASMSSINDSKFQDPITTSVGLAMFPDFASTSEALLNCAYDSLDMAKLSDGNSFYVYQV